MLPQTKTGVLWLGMAGAVCLGMGGVVWVGISN
ncbi:LPXTG-motif cell wall-anchored protein [Pedobacter sp. UYP30]